MGQISTKELANGGESNSKPFSIKLLNCEISDKEDAVKVTFSGAKDPVDSSLLVIGGGPSCWCRYQDDCTRYWRSYRSGRTDRGFWLGQR